MEENVEEYKKGDTVVADERDGCGNKEDTCLR